MAVLCLWACVTRVLWQLAGQSWDRLWPPPARDLHLLKEAPGRPLLGWQSCAWLSVSDTHAAAVPASRALCPLCHREPCAHPEHGTGALSGALWPCPAPRWGVRAACPAGACPRKERSSRPPGPPPPLKRRVRGSAGPCGSVPCLETGARGSGCLGLLGPGAGPGSLAGFCWQTLSRSEDAQRSLPVAPTAPAAVPLGLYRVVPWAPGTFSAACEVVSHRGGMPALADGCRGC